jgi:UDP-glucose 4-epimerase
VSRSPSGVVLGGGGFIGTNLCRRLLADGYRARAFGRRRLFPTALHGVEWFEGDFSDTAALAAAIESSDVVFHLISATPQSANLDMAGDIQQNVIPSLALINLSLKLGVRRIVFVSSGGTVYGKPRDFPTPETAATDPIVAYGISKLAIEKYLALHAHLYGLEYRVLRLANPFGPFQIPVKGQGIIAELISRTLRDESVELWGDGSVVRDFIFIDDVIDALIAAAIDVGSERLFNIGSGEGRSLREVMAAVERLLDRKVRVRRAPGRPIDVPVSVMAIDRAREHLGWRPKVAFETGLQATIDWWRALLSAGGREAVPGHEAGRDG